MPELVGTALRARVHLCWTCKFAGDEPSEPPRARGRAVAVDTFPFSSVSSFGSSAASEIVPCFAIGTVRRRNGRKSGDSCSGVSLVGVFLEDSEPEADIFPFLSYA